MTLSYWRNRKRRPLALFSILVIMVSPLSAGQKPTDTVDAIQADKDPSDIGLTLLGTSGGPIPRVERSQPASLLTIGDRAYVVDVGSGMTRQLVSSGHNVAELGPIFLTHLHSDHTGGIPGLFGFRWALLMTGNKLPPLAIYGPPGTKALVRAALDFNAVAARIFQAEAPNAPPIESTVTVEDAEPGIVYQDENVTVTAVSNTHYADFMPSKTVEGQDTSYAYRFDFRTFPSSLPATQDQVRLLRSSPRMPMYW